MQRLDKFLSSNTKLSRSEAVSAIKAGRVFVDGTKTIKNDIKIDENSVKVQLDGENVSYEQYLYFMLNKPQGVISASNDKSARTVIDLLPKQYQKFGLFPCGRLDKDTLGLVILTNDGNNAHRLLAPKNKIAKTYEFECAETISSEDISKIENGIMLRDGYTTKPCKIKLKGDKCGQITITEGKYHEIKRMFGAVSNKIVYLKRISFGKITLDMSLGYGEFRRLTSTEEAWFRGIKD